MCSDPPLRFCVARALQPENFEQEVRRPVKHVKLRSHEDTAMNMKEWGHCLVHTWWDLCSRLDLYQSKDSQKLSWKLFTNLFLYLFTLHFQLTLYYSLLFTSLPTSLLTSLYISLYYLYSLLLLTLYSFHLLRSSKITSLCYSKIFTLLLFASVSASFSGPAPPELYESRPFATVHRLGHCRRLG